MGDANTVARGLSEIAALLTLTGERFKARAYEHGAAVVAQLGSELPMRLAQKQLRDLEGIGAGLERQITELWEKGESDLLLRLRSQLPPGAAELSEISGMTLRRMRALSDALGISSAEQLREACSSHRVQSIKGFGEKLEQSLLRAVESYLEQRDAAEPQLLLVDAYAIAERFANALVGRVASRVELAGAARRGEELIRDLELVIEGEGEGDAVWRELSQVKGVVRIDREAGRAHLAEGIAARVHCATGEHVGAALLLATGDDAHLSTLRQRARTHGFELRAEGLRADNGELVRGDEAALYHALKLPWVPPELRTERCDLALAERDTFEDLLSSADIRGIVHCHTTYSDGKASVEEMARAAEAMGIEYLTITDHSPSARYAGGVELDRLKRQWEEIAEVQARVKVRILRGTEADILVDGALDYPDAVLEQFDVVIASVHARHRLDKDAVTARLSRALSLPLFKIWGHPLGRILLHRDPVSCDVPSVLDALASSRGAIELNGDPRRLDLPPRWIPLARERGIPFVVSADAHSVRGLRDFRHAVTMARRGGVRRHEVLNTLSAEAFAARVQPRA